MKFDRNKAFPYPVLRPHSDDYLNVEFQATVEFKVASSVALEVTYLVSSEELLSEVAAGRAAFLSVLSCRDTYFRKTLQSKTGRIESTFESGILRGEVSVDPYIVVTKPIPSFKSDDINPEFGPGPFSFSVGDVLAQDETQSFYIDRDVFKPVTSVFDIVKKDSLSGGEWHVGLEEDHVQIQVSQSMKETLDNARNDKSNQVVLINSIYFAAVMQALEAMKTNGSAFESRRWSKVMGMQLHNKGLDIKKHDVYVLAQRLMKYPLGLLETYVFKDQK